MPSFSQKNTCQVKLARIDHAHMSVGDTKTKVEKETKECHFSKTCIKLH